MGGSVETLACLDRGFQFAPLGRTVSPAQFMACPGALQAIPSPALAKFVGDGDSAGTADLYDVATWRRLRMSVFRRDPDDPVWVDVMTKRLADMRETWRLLDAAPAPRRLICICGTGLPTQIAHRRAQGARLRAGRRAAGRHSAGRDRRRRRRADHRAGVGVDGRRRGDRAHRGQPPPRHGADAGRVRGDPEGAGECSPSPYPLPAARGRGSEVRSRGR